MATSVLKKPSPCADVSLDNAGDDDIAGAVRSQMIGGIGLEPFAQGLGERVAKSRLECLVIERLHRDGFFAGHGAIDRAKVIAGAAGEREGGETR